MGCCRMDYQKLEEVLTTINVMKEEVIYIEKKSFTRYLNLDIMAFSFAYGGALGTGGEILVITKEAQIYSMNYAFGDMCIHMCYEVCPPLKDCIFGNVEVEKTPAGWKGISLGAGNFLVLSEPIYNQVSHDLLSFPPPIRYGRWKDMVINCLKSDNK